MGKGPYEIQLETIVKQGQWRVDFLETLRAHFLEQAKALEAIVLTSEEWEGVAATAAKGLMASMSDQFAQVEHAIRVVQDTIERANIKLGYAREDYYNLPDNDIPSSVPAQLRAAADVAEKIEKITIGPWSFSPKSTVEDIAAFLGHQREDAAARALRELDGDLAPSETRIESDVVPVLGKPPSEAVWPRDDFPKYFEPIPEPDPQAPRSRTVSQTPAIPPWTPPPGVPAPTPVPRTGPPFIDDDLRPNPVTPPTTPVPHPTGPGGGHGGGGGGGVGGGLIPGLGGAGGAAGLAAAARVGMGAGGGATGAAGAAGARLGSGLSGTAGSAAGAAGSGVGGAGGRGSSSVMGGGGAGGGAQEKEKRSGLGGLIAPKLEDDEELGPRSASADAGGRDSD